MNILVTGGAGYIGSHVVTELLAKGHWPITYDNLSGGHKESVLGGDFVEGDLADEKKLREVFDKYSIDATMHFAVFSLVGESMEDPQKYYYNNIVNGMNLLKVMLAYNIKLFIFSSTASVYGEPKEIPITENHSLIPVNPYGRSKAIFENILADYHKAHELRYISLRYFNAAGAAPAGNIGEDHNPETHLIPLVLRAVLAKRSYAQSTNHSGKELKIFGTDYPTHDGTCIRDYIYVKDLACAHVLALEALVDGMESQTFNLGNGNGYSVREVINISRKVTGEDIPVIESERRPGDPAVLVASSEKIKNKLGWSPKLAELEQIVETA